MSDLRIYKKRFDTIVYLFSERNEIWTEPVYQRMSDIWPLEKRQLLVDSILNGFDIPKLYFHELIPPREVSGTLKRFAIIDGKQRLESIWSFMDGKFALSKDFDYIHDREVRAGGMSYKDLAKSYPRLKSQFDATGLPITVVETNDTELIEEMFSRLNDAVPLNAAEKRNALKGPMPKAIRAVAGHRFFKDKLPYGNQRYRHYDLAVKFLYIEHEGEFQDTKKKQLDDFVKDFGKKSKKEGKKEADRLVQQVRRVASALTAILMKGDGLVSSGGMTILYYLLFREALQDNWAAEITRSRLEQFEVTRRENRARAEKDLKADFRLLEFDRYSQATNDVFAMKFRYEILLRHVRPT